MIPTSDLRRAAESVSAGSRILEVGYLNGGSSAVVARLRLESTEGSLHTVVVRQHRDRAVKGHSALVASTEYHVLRVLDHEGLDVPAPIALHDEDTAGGPWLAMEWVDGSPKIDPPMPDAALDSMASFLAGLHSLDPASVNAPGLDRIEDPSIALPGYLPADPVGRSVRSALAAGFDRSPNRDVLLHGDFWPGNVLLRDGRLVAVVDWEDAAIGDPLVDLACARVELTCAFGPEAAERFTADYLFAVGPLDTHDLPLWELYVSTTALSGMHLWGLEPAEEVQRRAATRDCFERAAGSILTRR